MSQKKKKSKLINSKSNSLFSIAQVTQLRSVQKMNL
jgi:hypothetical protein